MKMETQPQAGSGQEKAGNGQTAPETITDCASLREWVRQAQPNDRISYGRGAVFARACSPKLREYVSRLNRRGYLTPHIMRDENGIAVYIVRRTHCAVRP